MNISRTPAFNSFALEWYPLRVKQRSGVLQGHRLSAAVGLLFGIVLVGGCGARSSAFDDVPAGGGVGTGSSAGMTARGGSSLGQGGVVASGGAALGGSFAGGSGGTSGGRGSVAGGTGGGASGEAGRGGTPAGGTSGGGGRASCGNGIVEPGEACDAPNASRRCAYGVVACLVCDERCHRDRGITSYCGDGRLDAEYEQCDDGNSENDDGCSSTCSARPLSIAIESLAGCPQPPHSILLDWAVQLRKRGHRVWQVDGSGLDTPSELFAFDVVVLGGVRANCSTSSAIDNDLDRFDALIPSYLEQGGGLVASGWVLWGAYLDQAPNIERALPTSRSSFSVDGPASIALYRDPVFGNPLIEQFRFTPFVAGDYAACGGGTRSNASTLLSANGITDCGALWSLGAGRAAYLGPLFMEPYEYPDGTPFYASRLLVDGSQPGSVELFTRVIEWAGGFYE